MKFSEMTEMQQVAVAQSVYNELGKLVSRKGDTPRARVDKQVMGFYESTGAKSYDLNIAGQKVGTYSVTVSKEKTTTVLDLADDDAFYVWLDTDEGNAAITDWFHDHMREFANDYFDATGEVPPGIVARTVTDAPHVTGTRVSVDAAKVARVMRGDLPGAVAGLLGGA